MIRTDLCLARASNPGRPGQERHFLQLFDAPELRKNPRLSQQLGGIMRGAVREAPWNYLNWPLGEIDAPPGTETATGYIRLCEAYDGHFLVLWNERHGQHELEPVGVWAGAPIHPELVHTVHLDHGIEPDLVKAQFGSDEAPHVLGDGREYYHLIIAINGETDAEGQPQRSHRTSILNGKKAARVMVEFMIHHLAGLGFVRMFTKTHPAQAKMMRLFRDVGFAEIGRQTATHGTNSAERAIFLGRFDSLHRVDNSAHLLGDWYEV